MMIEPQKWAIWSLGLEWKEFGCHLGAGILEIVEPISQLRDYSPWIEASPVSFSS